MFYNSLTPGGFLVTEQTQKMPRETAYLFRHITSDVQLFQKGHERSIPKD